MLEHVPIKIENEVIENGAENATKYNIEQQIQDDHKVLTTENDLLVIEEISSVRIGEFEVIELEATKYVETSTNSKSYKNSNLENKKLCLGNNDDSENEINCKNVSISRRQSNEFTCSKLSIVCSDKADTTSCGNICVLYQQQKLIINCMFCDLNYGDIRNFKSHLGEDHKMFHLEDVAQKNSPRILRKRIGSRKELNHELKLEHLEGEVHTSESFGNVFISDQQELLMVCSSCDTKYAGLDLFEKHLQQQHHVFERSRIKSDTSTETVNTAENYESDSETMNLKDSIKVDKETITDNIPAKPSKRSVTKRKCTTKDNQSQQEDLERTETKLEPDLLQTVTQKTPTLINKRSRRTIKSSMELEEPISEDPSDEDQINEENTQDEKYLLKPLYEEQISNSISETDEKRLNEFDEKILKLKKLKELKERCNKEKKYKCTLCELAYFNKEDLSEHMSRHSTDRRYKCSYCSKGFKRNCDLMTHVRVHTGEKPFVCEICNTCFRAKQNLLVHRKSHMGEASKTYECEHCDKKFLRNIDRKVHMRTHTGEKPFRCEICNRGYSSKFNVKAHFDRDHISGNGRKKKKGPNPQALKEELDKQKKLLEELKPSKTDEKIITTELKSPIPEEDKPFVCDTCNKRFRANHYLLLHKKSHMAEASKTFECEQCDKKFIRNSDRKAHMRSHTGDKPYKCEICDRGFCSKFNMKAHVERDHISGNRRWKPGPQLKALKKDIDKHKKLIEELQQQLRQRNKTDEKIIPTEELPRNLCKLPNLP